MTTTHLTTSTAGNESCKTMGGGQGEGAGVVKFNKFNVSRGLVKARVFYSVDNRTDFKKCVTLYAKDYGHALREIFGNAYQNNTDIETDYFDQGRAVLFDSHPLYAAARARAEKK